VHRGHAENFSHRIAHKKHAGRGKVGLCLTVGAHKPLPACSFVSGRHARAQTHALAIYAADRPISMPPRRKYERGRAGSGTCAPLLSVIFDGSKGGTTAAFSHVRVTPKSGHSADELAWQSCAIGRHSSLVKIT
jgi:hypothetical protein